MSNETRLRSIFMMAEFHIVLFKGDKLDQEKEERFQRWKKEKIKVYRTGSHSGEHRFTQDLDHIEEESKPGDEIKIVVKEMIREEFLNLKGNNP